MSTLFAKTYAPEGDSILQEAQRVTHGDRQQAYGNPFDTYDRAAAIANILLRTQLSAADLALIMLAVKLSRESFGPKRDNRVDIAGFAWVMDRCKEQQAHDYAQMMHEAEAAGVPVGTKDSKTELYDIPHFLRMDPAIRNAAEAIVSENIRTGRALMSGLDPYAQAAAKIMKPYGEGLRENVIARASGTTMAERIAATNAAADGPLESADGDEIGRHPGDVLSDRINAENAG